MADLRKIGRGRQRSSSGSRVENAGGCFMTSPVVEVPKHLLFDVRKEKQHAALGQTMLRPSLRQRRLRQASQVDLREKVQRKARLCLARPGCSRRQMWQA